MKKFKLTGFYFIIISIFCVTISGCIPTPSIPPGPIDPRMLPADAIIWLTINSFAAPDAKSKGKVYYITSAIQNVIDDDLEFQEIAGYLENSLIYDGLIRTNNRKEADLLIRLGYGIGNPKTTSETYTTSTGYSYPVGWMWFTVPPKTQTVTNTTYMRTMIVEAYDLKDPNRKSQLWKTNIQSEGTSSDLRVIIPYMIAGSMVEMGTNTGQQKTVNISGHHPNIFYILKKASITADNFSGRKTVTFANGDKYEGDFVNGQRTGRGTYIWADGEKYEGDWVNGQRTGRGTYIFANGDKYEGDLINGTMHGKGNFYNINGNKYEGDWVNGKLHGKGTLTCNGQQFTRNFESGKPDCAMLLSENNSVPDSTAGGYLGCRIQAMTKELAEDAGLHNIKGVFVLTVAKNSPAELAGLKSGDIILTFDGKEINNANALTPIVRATPIGKTVDVVIYRDGKEQTFKVKIEKADGK